MTNQKLKVTMYAFVGLGLMGSVASAEVGVAKQAQILTWSPNDLAPTTGNPPRLQRTDQNQPGAEMSHLGFFAGNKAGIYFEMRSGDLCGTTSPGIGGQPSSVTGCVSPQDQIQLAAVPFHLVQDPADGSVSAVADIAGASFVTNNRGNERRNANHPIAYAVNNGNVMCAEYNYQPNNGNDTKRYMQCFDQTGKNVMGQTEIYAKQNDDCSMNQDANSTTVINAKSVAGTTKMITKWVAWRGCNGNGQDDGWMQVGNVTCDSAEAPTACTFAQQMDVSLCQQEERSRGFCSVGTDPDTAICSWTEGNDQPQHDGTWLAAVNINDSVVGGNQDASVLWKQQIDGRKGTGATRTYSMRAMHQRIMAVDGTGNLAPTDDIIWRSGDSHGNNNGNEGKGGTYYGNQMAVMTATKDGMTYKMPLTDMQNTLIGLDGTHLGMGFAMFGTTDKLTPGIVFIGGSQTGGGMGAQVRAVGYDTTANTLNDLGPYTIAPYDRHLYSNYLGNNPGNQGRNFSGSVMISNPFIGVGGNRDAYLMVMTTTGKASADMMNPERKLSSYITVLPMAQATDDGTGKGSGSAGGSGTTGSGGGDSGGSTTLGGCSATGATGGGMTLLLVGLAATIRRRRRSSN